MLRKFIPQLLKELEIENASLTPGVPGSFILPLDEGINVAMNEIPEGFIFRSSFAPYPKENEEAFSTQALLGNLFGQGTANAIIGLTQDGKTLTLTRIVDYPIGYKEFQEVLEDFINSIDFWRETSLSQNNPENRRTLNF